MTHARVERSIITRVLVDIYVVDPCACGAFEGKLKHLNKGDEFRLAHPMDVPDRFVVSQRQKTRYDYLVSVKFCSSLQKKRLSTMMHEETTVFSDDFGDDDLPNRCYSCGNPIESEFRDSDVNECSSCFEIGNNLTNELIGYKNPSSSDSAISKERLMEPVKMEANRLEEGDQFTFNGVQGDDGATFTVVNKQSDKLLVKENVNKDVFFEMSGDITLYALIDKFRVFEDESEKEWVSFHYDRKGMVKVILHNDQEIVDTIGPDKLRNKIQDVLGWLRLSPGEREEFLAHLSEGDKFSFRKGDVKVWEVKRKHGYEVELWNLESEVSVDSATDNRVWINDNTYEFDIGCADVKIEKDKSEDISVYISASGGGPQIVLSSHSFKSQLNDIYNWLDKIV